MDIFFLTLLIFFALAIVTGGLYLLLDRTLMKPKTLEGRQAKEIIDQSGIGWLSTVLYACFVALVFFILATGFSVNVLYNSYSSAFFYLAIIFPFAIIVALLVYFTAKFLAIFIMHQ